MGNRDMTCCGSCLRILMMFFNIVFSIIGFPIFVFGIVLIASPDWFMKTIDNAEINAILKDVGPEVLRNAAIVFIVIGVVTFLLGILGCCGARAGSRCLLGVFFTLVLIMVIVELAVGIAAGVFKSDVEKFLKDTMMDYFTNAMNATDGTDMMNFNALEKEFDCCGVNGIKDYMNSTRFHCAIATNVSTTAAPPTYKGCFEALEDSFMGAASILIGVGVGIGLIEILALVFSIYLCRQFGRDEYVA